MKKGLIITVNYNSHKETINYIKSLSKLDKFNYLDIIIADNSSNMTHYNEILHFVKNNAFNNIDLFKMERNLSYFGAARFIIDNKIAKEFRYEFIIVSNNDILVEDNNFVDKIFVNKYPKQGSGMISSIAFTDGIIEIPEDVSQISKGDNYKLYLFSDLFA